MAEKLKGSHALLVTAHDLAVDQAGPRLEMVHRFDHQRIALRPIVAPTGDQPDAYRAPASHKPVPVVIRLDPPALTQ
jgi:hypothetical protein